MSFEKYGLNPEILNGLADVRNEEPTPLQEKVLPIVLEGKHVLVEMHDKDDVAFLLPALQKITEHGEVAGTQVLILTPSIERAHEIDEQVWALGYHAQISSALLAMKGDKAIQEEALLDGAPVIVANPGRCIEILEKHKFTLNNLKLIVIDHAHEMNQYNLVSRVKDILRFVESEPQVSIFSKTQNNATKQLVDIALKNPELVGFQKLNGAEKDTSEKNTEVTTVDTVDLEKVGEKLESASVSVVLKKDKEVEPEVEPTEKASVVTSANNSDQGFIKVPPRMKISTLMAHLEQSDAKKVIIYSASSRTSDRLFKIIRKKNWGVVSLGDDLDDAAFNERLERFHKYDMRVLLVGGLSANKVELDTAEELINYDVPSELDEYRYRAEIVSSGNALRLISLVSKMDQEDMERISTEAGFPPVELPFPEENIQKKKKAAKEKTAPKSPRNKSRGKTSRPKNSRSQKKPKKGKSKSLPRPTYDGLSGGREGKETETGGVFGWVKKLFN